MAVVNVKHPSDLLGRSVSGSYLVGGEKYYFSGFVEVLVLPAPRFVDHQVEFFIGGEFVTLDDCLELHFLDESPLAPHCQP